MFFKPAPGFILLEPISDDTTLFIAGKEPLKKGTIIEIGENGTTEWGAKAISVWDKGDTVLHASIGYEEFTHNNKVYRVIPFGKIMGKYVQLN